MLSLSFVCKSSISFFKFSVTKTVSYFYSSNSVIFLRKSSNIWIPSSFIAYAKSLASIRFYSDSLIESLNSYFKLRIEILNFWISSFILFKWASFPLIYYFKILVSTAKSWIYSFVSFLKSNIYCFSVSIIGTILLNSEFLISN